MKMNFISLIKITTIVFFLLSFPITITAQPTDFNTDNIGQLSNHGKPYHSNLLPKMIFSWQPPLM